MELEDLEEQDSVGEEDEGEGEEQELGGIRGVRRAAILWEGGRALERAMFFIAPAMPREAKVGRSQRGEIGTRAWGGGGDVGGRGEYGERGFERMRE
ncbi:uncharacterized protein J3R85_002876 [Psidium guajava]|nr:uncharacterized protein J3R85_002876 [Psidium guajava]